MSTWIDFKELRSKLNFEEVLRHYNVEVKRKGNQHHGFCPLPNHNGKKNSPSFSANLDKGIFQCFGCGAKGNILDFAALMEKSDPKFLSLPVPHAVWIKTKLLQNQDFAAFIDSSLK